MPKYKSPDGRVYQSMYDAMRKYCRFQCGCAECKLCYVCTYPIEKWMKEIDPREAARMMGYEIIEDETLTEKTNTLTDTLTAGTNRLAELKNDVMDRPYVRDITRVCECNCSADCYPQLVDTHLDTAKSDGGKLRPSLVPPALIRGVDAIREYGCKKYSEPDNWRRVEPQRYWDALLRHVLAAWDDWKAVDEESGMPAIWHMACNLAFLMQYMEEEQDEKANQK